MHVLPITGTMRVPVRVVSPEGTHLNPETLERLRLLARQRGVFRHVVALPDVSWKPRNDTPCGTAVAIEDALVPQILDGEPNCGMRLMVANIDANALDDNIMDAIGRGLAEKIPTCDRRRKVIDSETFDDICLRGAEAVVERFGIDPAWLPPMQDGGNHFAGQPLTRRDVRRAVPSRFIRNFIRSRLGSLGSGNHFIELRRVGKIFDAPAAEQLGMREGQLAMMMHSGSTGLGVYVSHFYAPRPNVDWPVTALCHGSRIASGRAGLELKFLAYRLRNPRAQLKTLYRYDPESAAGRRYLTALYMASNFGYGNRTYLSYQVHRQLRETLSPSVEFRTVCCQSHVSIRREEHFGKPLWVHRHGATRSLPGERLPAGHPHRGAGEPSLVPGSLGSDAYLCVGHPENDEGFYSVNHGSGVQEGTTVQDPDPTVDRFRERLLQQARVRIYKGDAINTLKADPRSYRDIEASIAEMTDQRLVKPVCALTPLLAFKE